MEKAKKAPSRSPWQRARRLIVRITLLFFGASIGLALVYRWVNPPFTYLQIRERVNCPEGCTYRREWVDASDISLNMKLAVVASEDNNFMKHNGFDWGAIEKAKKYNEKHQGKKTRGASTISQQVAKNVFLWPGRSWVRKGFEVYFTFLIELFWPKERIMEVYLNVIEMGQCKFGVEAAAQDYFGKPASRLTRDEAALIAACLPNPRKMNPANPGPYLQKRRGQITRLMRLIGDSYFERYSKDWPEERRVKEEREVEQKIEALPDSEKPEPVPEEIREEVLPQETPVDAGEPAGDESPDAETPAAPDSSSVPG